MANFIIPGVL